MTASLRSRASRFLSLSMLLRLICAGGLVVDARVHLKLAPAYDSIKSSVVSQGDLFRIEAVMAIIAGLLVLVIHKRLTALLVVAVAGGGLIALLVYRYFDIGSIGPLPPMYEPAWYPDKTNTCIAQAVSTVAALVLLVPALSRSRKVSQAPAALS
ncbi:MAG: hypothetical protein NVS3B1_02700 [Marmoricola sp.]